MEENNLPQEELALPRTESEIMQECLPEAEVNRRLTSILNLPPDASATLIQEQFNLAILDELLFEFYGITDRRKATMIQLGKCLRQIKQFDDLAYKQTKKL